MRDPARQAKTALAVYLERGRKALASLNEGRIDEANAVLKKRSAAFHNFKAVDSIAMASGQDIAKDPEVLALWDEIRIVDKSLAVELKAAHAKTAALFQKIREAQSKIAAYQSTEITSPRFEKTA